MDDLLQGGKELVAGARAVGQQLDGQIKKAGDINAQMDRAEAGIDKARIKVRSVTMNRWVFSVWIVAGVLLAVIVLLWLFWHPKQE
jgi:type VI protein secretion system component VasF